MQTANSEYRKYKREGGKLTFREWITQIKSGQLNYTGTAPVNKPLTDSLNQVLSKIRGTDKLQTDLSNRYILGIDKNILIIAGVTAVVIGGIIVYKNISK
jgi:ABC-type dipeptide/oligopeptide/nickel transport system permease subunit